MNREQAREYIKQNIPCTDFLERSKNNMFCCPYPDCNSGHGANGTGAVKYYPNTNTWTCHACGRGHDVIDAFMQLNACDHNTALSSLAARAGITIDNTPTATRTPDKRPTGAENAIKDKSSALSEKNAQSQNISLADYTEYYKACAERITEPAAVAYLEARGIKPYTAASCGIGYDPAADPASAPGAMGDEYKPHPAPRLIIPCSKSHYVARSIDPKTPKEYKALNPAQTKGGGEVAIFNTAALRSGADYVFITEGVFDALSFLEAGQQAIALNSKNNGGKLIELLQTQRTASSFIICHDNEMTEDGQPDAKKQADTMKRAEQLQRDLSAMQIPAIIYNVAGDEHDANDKLRTDAEGFKKNIAAAIKEASRDELTNFFEKIQTEAYKPHKTGLRFFDNLIGGGIVNQSLLLLQAAPGVGKTTLCMQLAETLAANKRPVLYFNFEMSAEQMLAKAISAKAYHNGIEKTAMQILQGYSWTESDRAAIENVIDEYRRQSYPFIRYNPPGTTSELNDLLAYLERAGSAAEAKGQPAPAAVIDYLHLIKSRDNLDTAELIKQSVIGLKEYAVKHNTFVISIVATNREANKKGRQTQESGRDSSNLEYTADYQISLNYNDVDSGKVKPDNPEAMANLQQQTRRLMILRVLKSRFSQPGRSEKVMFDAAHNIFYGTADEFIPPVGFMLDDGAPAFDD